MDGPWEGSMAVAGVKGQRSPFSGLLGRHAWNDMLGTTCLDRTGLYGARCDLRFDLAGMKHATRFSLLFVRLPGEWSFRFSCEPVCFGALVLAALVTAASEFGAELDSLCDLVDFGVAPSLTIYAWY